MAVLVTGGAGYIGSHITRLLGDAAVVVDNLSSGLSDRIPGVPVEQLDLAAPHAQAELVRIIKQHGVDSVIHLSARKLVGESVERPEWYYAQNIGGMANLLGAMRETGVAKLVFAALKSGGKVKVFGDKYPTPDGTCIRDYVHVQDLADAHVLALDYLDRDQREFDTFNVGTGSGASVFAVVDVIHKTVGFDFEVEVVEARAGDPARLCADVSRIKSTLGWVAKHDLKEIVRSAWAAIN
jgi:UDP-glucose 4-epimerase